MESVGKSAPSNSSNRLCTRYHVPMCSHKFYPAYHFFVQEVSVYFALCTKSSN